MQYGIKGQGQATSRKKKLTHTQLAATLGKSEGAIRSWEMGRTRPDTDILIKLANYFDCTTDYLLGMPETNMRTIEIVRGLDAYSDDELLKEIKRRLATAATLM